MCIGGSQLLYHLDLRASAGAHICNQNAVNLGWAGTLAAVNQMKGTPNQTLQRTASEDSCTTIFDLSLSTCPSVLLEVFQFQIADILGCH